MEVVWQIEAVVVIANPLALCIVTNLNLRTALWNRRSLFYKWVS